MKFWNWVKDEKGTPVLRISGPIDGDGTWDRDACTPSLFRDELEKVKGDYKVYINSPGGSVFAAAEIYTMIMEHKGNATVVIDALAASAASVIAMAGTRVIMSPVAMLMIHDPATIAWGNAAEMAKTIEVLNEVKATIVNAYQLKTGRPREELEDLMAKETWMNAYKAKELGFCDEVMSDGRGKGGEGEGEGKEDAAGSGVASMVDAAPMMFQAYARNAALEPVFTISGEGAPICIGRDAENAICITEEGIVVPAPDPEDVLEARLKGIEDRLAELVAAMAKEPGEPEGEPKEPEGEPKEPEEEPKEPEEEAVPAEPEGASYQDLLLGLSILL